MALANQADFLDEGTGQGAFAPQETPLQRARREEQQRQLRRDQLRRQGQSAANANVPGQNTRAAQAVENRKNDPNWALKPFDADGDAFINDEEAKNPAFQQYLRRNQKSFGQALLDDPLTLGILAAPALLTGAGLALAPAAGAAVTGGTATAAGSSALAAPYAAGGAYGGTVAGGLAPAFGTAAGTTAAAVPAITTGGAMTAPTLAAPTALGATGTAAAADGGITAGQVIAGAQTATAAGMLAKDLFGSDGDAEKLKRKQAALAEEARVRMGTQHQQQMNALGQQMLAFNPQNQLMAQMFGPQAAFSPEQFAAMAKDPASVDPALVNYQGADPAIQKKVEAEAARLNQDKERQAKITAGMTPLPAQQAAFQMPKAQAQRKF